MCSRVRRRRLRRHNPLISPSSVPGFRSRNLIVLVAPTFQHSSITSAAAKMEPQDTSMTNLIINYLPQSMTDKKLHQMFTQVGQIEACRVMKDVKVSLPYLFVFFCFLHGLYPTVDGCLSRRRCRRGRPVGGGEGAHTCRINGLPGGKTRFIFYISSRFSPLSYVHAHARACVYVRGARVKRPTR